MKNLAVALAILLLVGCQSLGLATPQTFNQKLAVGYGTCTVLITTTDQLLKAGKLSSVDAVNVETQVGNLKTALDIAQQVSATDTTTANSKLEAAVTALNALAAYLASKGGG